MLKRYSQRQLPTDHDHAVPTREYQIDQSSLKTTPAAAGPVLDKQKPPHSHAEVDRSLHIRAINAPAQLFPVGCAHAPIGNSAVGDDLVFHEDGNLSLNFKSAEIWKQRIAVHTSRANSF